MHMHEISLVFMEMDAILRSHSDSDIAPRNLFHIHITRKVPRFPVDIHRHIGMVVDLIGTRSYQVCQYNCNDEDEEGEEGFHEEEMGYRI